MEESQKEPEIPVTLRCGRCGRRGLQVEIRPLDLQRVLPVIPVKVGIPSERGRETPGQAWRDS